MISAFEKLQTELQKVNKVTEPLLTEIGTCEVEVEFRTNLEKMLDSNFFVNPTLPSFG